MKSASPWKESARRFLRHKVAVAACVVLALIFLAALLGPPLSKTSPETQHLADQYSPPSAESWFGTDLKGRDLFVRLLYGSRVSLLIGISASLVSLLIGLIIGTLSGYAGGWTDRTLMRTVDILYGLPVLVLVMLVLLYVPKGHETFRLYVMSMALGGIYWLTLARIVRGQVLTVKNREFVEAAHALGARGLRVTTHHLLPNLLGPVLVYFTLSIPQILLAESFLSFLGLGVRPPAASWGTLLADGVEVMNAVRIYWWLVFFPALTLGLTLFCFNVIGDGLRDALDVN